MEILYCPPLVRWFRLQFWLREVPRLNHPAPANGWIELKHPNILQPQIKSNLWLVTPSMKIQPCSVYQGYSLDGGI